MSRLALLFAFLSGACASAGSPPAPTGGHLFVATLDGDLRVLDLEGGAPVRVSARAELGEALRFLALHPDRPIVYALGDTRLHALAWDEGSGSLAPLGEAEAGVRGTHVAIDPTGEFAIIASYGGNSIALMPLGADGAPGATLQVLDGGEDGPYQRAHQVRVHAETGAVHVPCLGCDHVAVLGLDRRAGSLALRSTAATPAGAGPRHMDYHPTLPVAYALNERASSVTSFAIDDEGNLEPVGTITTLPEGFAEEGSRSSDVHVSLDGRFLFAVNREPLNDIVTFAIEGDGSRLRALGRVPTGGDHARTFAVDPTGERLWVANTRSRELTTFRIRDDGTLEQVPGTWVAEADISCVLAR